MQQEVLNMQGTKVAQVDMPELIFARKYNQSLVHQILCAHASNARQGTRAQKTRSEVAGSTKKPWKQKGTGRARVGTKRNPVWRSGGVAHPSKADENFTKKVNRKMFKGSLACVLSRLLKEQRILLVDELSLAEAKTKLMISFIKNMGFGLRTQKVLIVDEQLDMNFCLALRNVQNIEICTVNSLLPSYLLDAHKILISRSSLDRLEALFSAPADSDKA